MINDKMSMLTPLYHHIFVYTHISMHTPMPINISFIPISSLTPLFSCRNCKSHRDMCRSISDHETFHLLMQVFRNGKCPHSNTYTLHIARFLKYSLLFVYQSYFSLLIHLCSTIRAIIKFDFAFIHVYRLRDMAHRTLPCCFAVPPFFYPLPMYHRSNIGSNIGQARAIRIVRINLSVIIFLRFILFLCIVFRIAD